MMNKTLSFFRTLGLSLVFLLSASQSLQATSAELHQIGVISFDTGDDLRADVPGNTNWSSTSLAAAKVAQYRAAASLQVEIGYLEKAGAVRINKVYEPKARIARSWAEYLPELRKFKLVGVDGFGNIVKESPTFPLKGESVATLAVDLNDENCRLGNFNFWNFSTWFLSECKVLKGTSRNFLRIATREAHLQVDQTELTTAIQYYWMQLEGCLTNNYAFTLQNNFFKCPENQRGFGGHIFLLDSRTGMGGYEFKVYPESRTATIRYLAPDYAEFAKGVTAVSGTPNLRFRQPLVLEGGIVP